jgi:hypothetical protein
VWRTWAITAWRIACPSSSLAAAERPHARTVFLADMFGNDSLSSAWEARVLRTHRLGETGNVLLKPKIITPHDFHASMINER